MKISLTSVGFVCLSLLCSLITETAATPSLVLDATVLDPRAPGSRSSKGGGRAGGRSGKGGAAAASQSGYDKFVNWLKSPTGMASKNICFWSGSTGGVSVATKLPELAKKTKCEYTGSLLIKAKIPKAESDAFTLAQWAVISQQLAKNARGKAKALLGDTMRHDAIFYVDEYPILEENMQKGLVTGIDHWKMDPKGKLTGPIPYVHPE